VQTFKQAVEIWSGPEAFLFSFFLKTWLNVLHRLDGRRGIVGGVGEYVKYRSEQVLDVSLGFSNLH